MDEMGHGVSQVAWLFPWVLWILHPGMGYVFDYPATPNRLSDDPVIEKSTRDSVYPLISLAFIKIDSLFLINYRPLPAMHTIWQLMAMGHFNLLVDSITARFA